MAIEAFQAINFKDYSSLNSKNSISASSSVQKSSSLTKIDQLIPEIPVENSSTNQAKQNNKQLGLYIDFYA